MTKLTEYKQLLSKNYDKAVEFLLKKHGTAEDDYFSGKSYERFLKGEIKNITKGNFSRSDDGLECHHVDEDKFLNISNRNSIKDFTTGQNVPFESHKKERLVFCDVIEHAILHILIAKETSLVFGFTGYMCYLQPKIQEWYIDKNIPQKSKHHITCYHKAYIKPEEAFELLEIMDNILFIENEKNQQEKKEIENEEKIKKEIESLKKLEKLKAEEFYSTYPKFKILDINYDVKRQQVLALLFKFNDQYNSFIKFQPAMKKYSMDELLKKLHSVVK
ncbi:hypothetical protein [Desemzia sp. FAM 23989]|uniref:hypothetical protein n=1 Tax=Desemzia sp. FAM 23989 TaxID=3259523 RepID=UPI0038896F40